MAHAIGALGSSIEQRTKRTPMTKEQRERNKSLVPRPRRNQMRAIAFVQISRDGEKPKVKAIRAGHMHHYQAAYIFAKVSPVLTPEGKPLIVKRPK